MIKLDQGRLTWSGGPDTVQEVAHVRDATGLPALQSAFIYSLLRRPGETVDFTTIALDLSDFEGGGESDKERLWNLKRKTSRNLERGPLGWRIARSDGLGYRLIMNPEPRG